MATLWQDDNTDTVLRRKQLWLYSTLSSKWSYGTPSLLFTALTSIWINKTLLRAHKYTRVLGSAVKSLYFCEKKLICERVKQLC